MENKVYIFKTHEEIENFYQELKKNLINNTNEQKEIQIENIEEFNKQFQIELYKRISSDNRKVLNSLDKFSIKILPTYIKYYLLLFTNKFIFTTEQLEENIELFETYFNLVEEYKVNLKDISNLLSGVLYYIVKNKYNVEEDTSYELFSIWRIIMNTLENINIKTNQDLNSYDAYTKGITYYGKHSINPDYLFEYVYNKLNELNLINEMNITFTNKNEEIKLSKKIDQ